MIAIDSAALIPLERRLISVSFPLRVESPIQLARPYAFGRLLVPLGMVNRIWKMPTRRCLFSGGIPFALSTFTHVGHFLSNRREIERLAGKN